MSQKKLLFLTLNTFSSTGGIEKVCRVAGKALQEIAEESGGSFTLFAMNDKPNDLLPRYVAQKNFEGFDGNKLKFVLQSIKLGCKSGTVILSHINLLIIGYLVKLISPKTKILLIAHGIEVWEPLQSWKIKALKKLDLILPVSQFTKEKLVSLYGLADQRVDVINNCLDPFLTKKSTPQQAVALRQKFGLSVSDFVLFTLTRIKSSEQYKGYDKVITALPEVLKQFPHVKYLVAGKYDPEEKRRMDNLINDIGIQNKVIFAGFISDEEVENYFSLADLYVMPSTGEGFGIVFIEALFYGKPVIAGDQDGSVDALANGIFGRLVNPNKLPEVTNAIVEVISKREHYIPDDRQVEEYFGYSAYKRKLSRVVNQ